MPWEAGVLRRGLILLLALSLVSTVPAGVAGLTDDRTPDASPEADGEDRSLVEPMLRLAWTPSETDAVERGHAAGQAWAEATLAQPPTLADAVEDLYTALAIDTPAATAPVPEAFNAPLGTLVALQTHHAAATGPYAGLSGEEAQAFTLGALEPVLEALEEARHEAPEEPVFVDPLGLILLGGSGDNHFEPHDIGPTTWKGAILLVEPAGNDTYDVPVAAPTEISSSHFPPIDIHPISLALELGGNDAYNDRTAGTERWMPAILVDRGGNDTYAATDIEGTTAHASPGFAYLLDEEGNDAYHAEREGIAHAYRGGTAILWDQLGHDTYQGHIETFRGGSTHAMADSRQAKALLWDELGQDTYIADGAALGTTWNDAYARFLDEEGDDDYHVETYPNSSFGFQREPLRPLVGDRVTGLGFGEFVDASGNDIYTWTDTGPPFGKNYLPQNDDRFVDTRDDHRYGVFIDCQTPADADRPCEEEQHQARCTMVRHPAEFHSEVEPLVALVLDPIEDECRQHGPVP